MISRRIDRLIPSATSAFLGRVAELRENGTDIISFNVGEPDFATPSKVVDSCCRALKSGHTKYESVEGILPLREAICGKLLRDNALSYRPDQICVSTGAKQALFNAIMSLCDVGDEVIIPVPCWVSYVEMVKLAGGVPVLVPTNPDYSLNHANIENAITEKTKLLILNSPNNPTGVVYSKDALLKAAELADQNDLYVISDEVYEKLIYDGKQHFSIAAASKKLYERTVVVNGFSKAFSMTGWRIGYSAASPEITQAMISLQSHMTSNSTSFVQYAAVAALDACDGEIESMRQAFAERRDYMYRRLTAMEGIKCSFPEGAFYLLPDVSAYIGTSFHGRPIHNAADLCKYLLEHAGIAAVPGDAFFMPNTIRFSYATSMEKICEGMDRMERALNT